MNKGTGQWVLRISGAPSDLHQIACELTDSDPKGVARGESLYVKSSNVDEARSKVAAEWAALDLTQLLSAAGSLHFGTPISLRLVSVDPVQQDAGDWPLATQNVGPTASHPTSHGPSPTSHGSAGTRSRGRKWVVSSL
jgi:hypothetical protein